MNEIDFTSLRLQIENLAYSQKQALQENNSLRIKLAKMIQERALLLHAKANTAKKVKTIIEQIRKELHESREK